MYLNISEVLANDTRLFKHNAEFIPKSNIACSVRGRKICKRVHSGNPEVIYKALKCKATQDSTSAHVSYNMS